MTIMLIISALLLVLYIGLTIYMFGIPSSVSESYYLYKREWYFTITMFLSSFLLAPKLISSLDGSNFQFVTFFIVASMAFVGASPAFKEGLDRKVHLTCATILFVSSEAYMLFLTPYNYIALLCMFAIIYPTYKEYQMFIKTQGMTKINWLFWIEIAIILPLYIIALIY